MDTLNNNLGDGQEQEPQKTFPTPPAEDGRFFASEEDEVMGIQTVSYENGGITKTATLSDGRPAVCRRLKGFEVAEIYKRLGRDAQADIQTLTIAKCVKVADENITPEEVRQLWGDDYQLLLNMASINFPKA